MENIIEPYLNKKKTIFVKILNNNNTSPKISKFSPKKNENVLNEEIEIIKKLNFENKKFDIKDGLSSDSSNLDNNSSNEDIKNEKITKENRKESQQKNQLYKKNTKNSIICENHNEEKDLEKRQEISKSTNDQQNNNNNNNVFNNNSNNIIFNKKKKNLLKEILFCITIYKFVYSPTDKQDYNSRMRLLHLDFRTEKFLSRYWLIIDICRNMFYNIFIVQKMKPHLIIAVILGFQILFFFTFICIKPLKNKRAFKISIINEMFINFALISALILSYLDYKNNLNIEIRSIFGWIMVFSNIALIYSLLFNNLIRIYRQAKGFYKKHFGINHVVPK